MNTPVGFWRPSPYSPHVVHFVINLPGSWECRHTIQNILRIAWMDVFEHAGWTILSMWNSTNSAAESSSQPSVPVGIACSAAEDSAAETPSAVAAPAIASDGTGGVAGADLTDFKGECANFLLFKRAGTVLQHVSAPAMPWPHAPLPAALPAAGVVQIIAAGAQDAVPPAAE
eukprot:CAMPEP_0172164906 /NCGR_PEP_ID=MMETSP1050-20130122/8109_1 /TAXON_ID=233186 /ORGANISM="Cryptomonas curvata, Strain CCAP979/52" /LENGTH=171 /DNA_ID=CAMNT_0012835303 /DNA_START=196 /DNA_END=708 /DNA_ORIENTATION=-